MINITEIINDKNFAFMENLKNKKNIFENFSENLRTLNLQFLKNLILFFNNFKENFYENFMSLSEFIFYFDNFTITKNFEFFQIKIKENL